MSGFPPRWPPIPPPPGAEGHPRDVAAFPNAFTQNNYYHYYYYYYFHHQYGDFYNIPPLAVHKMHAGGGDFLHRPLSNLLGGENSGWPNSPVGPVAGAVMAIFIVVVLGVYCLRHQASAARRRRNAAAAQLAAVSGGAAGNVDGNASLSEQHPPGGGGPDKSGGGTGRSGTDTVCPLSLCF